MALNWQSCRRADQNSQKTNVLGKRACWRNVRGVPCPLPMNDERTIAAACHMFCDRRLCAICRRSAAHFHLSEAIIRSDSTAPSGEGKAAGRPPTIVRRRVKPERFLIADIMFRSYASCMNGSVGHIVRRLITHDRISSRIFCSATILLLSAACSLIEPEQDISYVITVRLDTPDGIVSNNSTWKVRIKDAWLSSAHGTISSEYFGQAIPVKYKSNTVYGLLYSRSKPDLPVFIVAHCLKKQFPRQDWRKSWKSAFPIWEEKKSSFVLPEHLYPFFVHFSGNKNISKNLILDEKSISDALGKNVKIAEVSVQMGAQNTPRNHSFNLPTDTHKGVINWRPGIKDGPFEVITVAQFEKGPLD